MPVPIVQRSTSSPGNLSGANTSFKTHSVLAKLPTPAHYGHEITQNVVAANRKNNCNAFRYDAATVARLISAAAKVQARPVHCLSQAVGVLGTRRALLMSLQMTMPHSAIEQSVSQLWQHSVLRALIAERLAGSNNSLAEEYFAIGLLSILPNLAQECGCQSDPFAELPETLSSQLRKVSYSDWQTSDDADSVVQAGLIAKKLTDSYFETGLDVIDPTVTRDVAEWFAINAAELLQKAVCHFECLQFEPADPLHVLSQANALLFNQLFSAESDFDSDEPLDAIEGFLNPTEWRRTVGREELASELRRHLVGNVSHSTGAVVMFQPDGVEEISEKYGSVMRQAVLSKFSSILCETVSQNDLLAQIDEKTFAVLLHDTDDAVDFAERMRQRVDNTLVEADGYVLSTTASAGVLHLRPEEMATQPPGDVIQQSRCVLQFAVDAGGNIVKTPEPQA